jgi:hypothetical protein
MTPKAKAASTTAIAGNEDAAPGKKAPQRRPGAGAAAIVGQQRETQGDIDRDQSGSEKQRQRIAAQFEQATTQDGPKHGAGRTAGHRADQHGASASQPVAEIAEQRRGTQRANRIRAEQQSEVLRAQRAERAVRRQRDQ